MIKRILVGLAFCIALPSSAAIVDHGTYFKDTDTGLYWLKLTETRDMSYDDVDVQTVPGQPFEGWRYASLEEVESFIAAYGFPNRGNNCGDGWGNYCDTVSSGNGELIEGLIRLFGDTADAGYDESNYQYDVSPNGAGAAYGMLGQRGDPGGSYYYHVYEAQIFDSELIVRSSGEPAFDQNDSIRTRWNTASDYGSSTTGSFLVRTSDPTIPLDDPSDPNTLNVTLFDSLSPGDVGLSAYLYCDPPPGGYFPICGYDAYEWWADGTQGHDVIYYGEFQLENHSFDQEARPWVRMTGYDYSSGNCQTDTDLGGGWCQKDLSSAEFVLMPLAFNTGGNPYVIPEGVIPGTHIDEGDSFELDNVKLEFINSNIQIDFEQWNSADTIRPKEAYFTTVGVKTLSIADGDAVDFDATQIDPATVMFGPARTANVAQPIQTDFDNDGDTDIVFGFRVEDSGVSCLDTSVTLVAKTLSGDPLAGQTSVTPINCEEIIDIDVDPFNAANVIRPNDSYNVTVAILGMRTADGDAVELTPGSGAADDIDVATLRFGPAETTNTTAPVITDIDGDTHDDMLVTFNAYDAGIACADTELDVTGEKVSGIPVEAIDSIQTDDCETGGCHP
jgi:hypothetical protein